MATSKGMAKKAAKSVIIIVIFTLASKPLGFIREALIAAKFGAGMETDAFFIAMSATGLITRLVSSTIATTFIPVLSEVGYKEGKEGKVNHTNNMINIIFLYSLLLISLGFIAAPILVKILAKGFHGKQHGLAVRLTRIGLPKLLFSGIIGTLTGFLHSEQRHTSAAAVGFPLNFVFIFFLIFLSGTFGIKGLMVASVLAVVSQLLIQLPEAIKAGYKYKFVFDLKDEYVKRVLYLSLPVFIGVAINDLNTIVDRTMASSLISGSISALSYASKLNSLVLGVFVSAITTVIFPLLSKEVSSDNIPSMKKIMGYGVNLIMLITIPATVGLVILATPIVQIAFQRGEFDGVAAFMTTRGLIFYSVGLTGMALRTLLNRAYYSLQDTRTPMIGGAISLGLNIVFNLILIRFMAHAGLALATSIATTVVSMAMFYGLRKKIGPFGIKSFIKCAAKAGLASAIMGVVVYTIYHGLHRVIGISLLHNLISLLTAVVAGAIVYGALCYVFGIKEVKDIVGKVWARVLTWGRFSC